MRRLTKIVANSSGQQTVEFLMMLGTVITFILLIMASFHKQLAGGFFTLIGNILG